MTEFRYADETKDGRYVLVASVHLTGSLAPARRLMRDLTLPGQTRVHMRKERDSRRRTIISALIAAGITATIYDVGRYSHELDARHDALSLLLADIDPTVTTRLTLEQDDSLLAWDRRALYDLARKHHLGQAFTYDHQPARTEPLLGIPDAIAWCWAKGGDWRRRLEPLIGEVRRP
ncbi:hypothetical protein PZ938_00155 [Luteipulveratus sp. YIM 133132]|uniref:hypothetical protein n=1 Tax=Luteipulveratus flavus TaxID=3031728 RepID=UPI0023B02102|nr:hypothetical protein [Luteipulveratus sp. YIM 133132]MDE9364006.1 hypothetical protein [Luteipulveratus sp. YIM 133132]